MRLLGTALLAMWTAVAFAVIPDTPTVDGPITGPEPMHPGIRQGPEGTNFADFDYVADEYFVSGTAGPTGATYKVRMMVWRPAKPEKFSGVVVYEPTHQGGNALICQFARYGIYQRGHICITVSSQAVVLTSTTVNPAIRAASGSTSSTPSVTERCRTRQAIRCCTSTTTRPTRFSPRSRGSSRAITRPAR